MADVEMLAFLAILRGVPDGAATSEECGLDDRSKFEARQRARRAGLAIWITAAGVAELKRDRA